MPITLADHLRPFCPSLYTLSLSSPAILSCQRSTCGTSLFLSPLLAAHAPALVSFTHITSALIRSPQGAVAAHYAERASGHAYGAAWTAAVAARLGVGVRDVSDRGLRAGAVPAGAVEGGGEEAVCVGVGGLVGVVARVLESDFEEALVREVSYLEGIGWRKGVARVRTAEVGSQVWRQVDFRSERETGDAKRRFARGRAWRAVDKGRELGKGDVCAWLFDEVGVRFEVVGKVGAYSGRIIARALGDCLDAEKRGKMIMAFVRAVIVQGEEGEFGDALERMGVMVGGLRKFGLAKTSGQREIGFAEMGGEALAGFSNRERLLLAFVKVATPSDSTKVDFDKHALPPGLVQELGDTFSAAEIIDFVFWMGMLELLRRLDTYYLPSGRPDDLRRHVPFMGDMAFRARAALQDEGFDVGVTAAALAHDDVLTSSVVRERKETNPLTALYPSQRLGDRALSVLGLSSSRGASSIMSREPSTDGPPPNAPHPDTLAAMLHKHRVPFARLKVRHYGMMKLQKLMLGSAPNMDSYLAIYPPGLRSYMLLIPNMLNVPNLLLGTGTPSSVIAVALHYSSRASKSRYCSLHTCCFALRRGIPAAVLQSNVFNEAQASAVDTALRLGTFPSTMTRDSRDILYEAHSADDVEWIIMAIAMMGFLQKFADTCVCQLEAASYDLAGDFLTSLGWGAGRHLIAAPLDKLQELDRRGNLKSDRIKANLSALPFVPSLLLWQQRVTRHVPSTYPACGEFLRKRVGWHFPFLGKLRHRRCVKTLTTILRDGLDAAQCNLPPATKLLCGILFATIAHNDALVYDFHQCVKSLGRHLLPGTVALVIRFAEEELDFDRPITLTETTLREAGADLTLIDRRALLLVKAGSTSPATIKPVVLDGIQELFTAPALIEVLTWLGICQMMHRLYMFYMNPDVLPLPAAEEAGTGKPSDASLFRREYSDRLDGVVSSDDARRRECLEEKLPMKADASMSVPLNSGPDDVLPAPVRPRFDDSCMASFGRVIDGKLTLHGARPVYVDDGPASEIVAPGSESQINLTRTKRLFTRWQHVQEDEMTKLSRGAQPSSQNSSEGRASDEIFHRTSSLPSDLTGQRFEDRESVSSRSSRPGGRGADDASLNTRGPWRVTGQLP